MERTPEQMRVYLDQEHPPDLEDVAFYSELANWPDREVLSEEAKQAYIDEHLQVCAWCGQTREWHNHHAVRDHSFDPNERVPIEG